jgi:putative heme degradation protein
MLEIKNSDTQIDLLMFFSIWAAGFALKDVKS